MTSRLLFKVLAINLPLLVAVIAVVWLAVDYLAADYFMVLMDKYHVNPVETQEMFLSAVHRYLVWASVGGLGLALGMSVFLTRRVLRPLSEMAGVSRRIARGDYDARVEARSGDEVGELAKAFNAMADNLARIEQLRKTMVSDVAHELRTPLTNLRGYLEGLRDGVVAPAPDTLRMLLAEVERLGRLVSDLQQLTRADAARTYLKREKVRLEELAGEALNLFRPRFEEKGIKVDTAFPEGLEPVAADRAQLLQVLRNLLQNALQYTPEGGAVTVSAERERDGVRLAVTNTGAEIPAEELPLIFERFYRVDKSRSRASGGAGIGLAIVRQLVEAHGGRVGADSAAGRTRVWFALPA